LYVLNRMDAQQELTAIAAAKADPRAFTPLYSAYHAVIFRFIHRRTNHRDLSADLTQQTFLKALLALPRYESRGLPFRAWLYRIALNEVRMHWRKKKETVMDLSWAEVRELRSEVGVMEAEEDLQRLAGALSRLPAEKGRLIELRYIDGLSFIEVGQVLGIAEDAAKMRVHRVLATLRQYLGSRT
jgi:RNA polymerase sigma-70 factor (ECF subfamily)